MKILLVDDEEQVLRGVSRMLESEMEDWEVETAESGDEALQLLESDQFNVIVSDMRMPGMDGAQLLGQVASRFPKILRVVLSGQADRETVMRAIQPMHQYLSKPCDPFVLIEIIGRAEIFQETILSVDVLDAIGKANCLPSVPDIVSDMNRELERDSCNAKSVSAIVSRDPVVTARLLQLANSAIFGMRQPVVELDRAVGVVGNEMVRSLVLSQALFSEGNRDSILSTEKLFDHCLRTAMVGRKLAAFLKLDSSQVNSVFTGGLLHDIGKIILANAFPERYEKILEASKQSAQTTSELELSEFGANHQGVGAYLLELWGIPSKIIEVVGAHHSFEICANKDLTCQIVFAANWIENGGDESVVDSAMELAESTSSAAEFQDRLLQWKNYYMNQATEEKADG